MVELPDETGNIFQVIEETFQTEQKNLYQEYERQYLETLSESKYSYKYEQFCKFVERARPKL